MQIGGTKKRPKLTHKLFFEDEKGLDKMLRTFPKIKLKGKGREYEDLSLMLQHYRKWFQELYPYGEHFEDLVWKARQVLQEQEKDDDGHASDPRELLHAFRLKYKNAAAAASGANLSDEAKARIEANRQRALELKRKKEAETGKGASTENQEIDIEEIWRMEEEHAAASKAQPQGAPGFDAFDEDEDVFGFGGDFDDFGDPGPRAPAVRATSSTDTGAPATHVADDVRAKIEANRLRALELKKQKEAQANKTSATEREEAGKGSAAQSQKASIPDNPEDLLAQGQEPPDFDPFDEEEDPFGFGGFDDP
jgi:hypothetical protein